MLHKSGECIKSVTVSDSTRKLGKMSLSLNGYFKVSNESVDSLYIEEEDKTILLISLPKGVYVGKSISVLLQETSLLL